ncbi:hypothetical protein SmJEL517_g03478 [Synchytrium microbalum]|uniref:Epg5-like TPR domain-containing protein n=1 Tax=Synchytrium microbalum TaxID=1806994 RepID=A0A507C6R1_9FUNG|nr:uncharacterized protein SmJEL517_g03478 [Synchytrium microbalum]TPX33744.1 hypothetical protein SmJEL517_g03478 [Synchytrium microbalum]
MEQELVRRKKPSAKRKTKIKSTVQDVVDPVEEETVTADIEYKDDTIQVVHDLEALRPEQVEPKQAYPDLEEDLEDSVLVQATSSNVVTWTDLRRDVTVSDALYPTAPTVAESIIATPTAPPLFTEAPRVAVASPNVKSQIRSLPEKLLETIYINPQLDLHSQVVDEFRGQSSNLTSEFASRVREYEQAFVQTQRTKLNLQALKAKTKSAAARMWTLKKDTHTLEGTCSDGIRVSHTYASEVAVYNESVALELADALTEAREEQYGRLTDWAFQAKVAKLWIQNTLDEFLSESSLVSSDTLHSNVNLIRIFTEGAHADPAGDFSRLKHYLDVLFYFERRNNGVVPARPDSPEPSDSNKEPHQDMSHSILVRDIRGWIAHLVSALLTVAGPLEHRFILLHVMRCEGIGSWGASFIQWPLPIPYTDSYQNHYLVALSVLLGPVEELEEELKSRENDDLQIRESLRKLEDSDWVVVDESEAHPDFPSRVMGPIALTEEDYLVILDQFNISAIYQLMLQHYVSLYKESREVSQTSQNPAPSTNNYNIPPILQMFATIHQFLGMAMRAFTTFPPIQYPHVIKRIGQTLVGAARQTGEALVALLDQMAYDEMYSNSRSLDDIMVVSGYMTSIQAEMDSFVVRTAKKLLGVGGVGVYQFLSSLPVDYCSTSARAVIIDGLLKEGWARYRTTAASSRPTEVQHQLLALIGENQSERILSSSLIENPNESVHLLTFLCMLACANGDGLARRRVASAPTPQTAQLSIKVETAIFNTCYLDLEHRDVLSRTGRDLLGTMCTSSPELMSPLLILVRDNFGDLGVMALNLFKTLPLKSWRPNVEDLDILQNMLKDPVGSKKFFFAKHVLGALNWGTEDPSDPAGELAIPRTLHRFIALAISNIYLDRQSVRDARPSVVAAASTAASATLRGVASVAPVPSSIASYAADHDADFAEWTWKLLVGLQLYQRPSSSSPDVYALDMSINTANASIRAGFRPFEPLDSPYLATHRGAMKSSALAAYIVLAVSEVGHRWEVFSNNGWNLLNTLASSGRTEPVLKVASDLFVTFMASRGETVLEDAESSKFFGNFFKNYKMKGEVGDADARQLLEHFIRTIGPNKSLPYWQIASGGATDRLSLTRFWMRAIFADRDWVYNRSSLRLLDILCESAFAFSHDQYVRGVFAEEYGRLCSSYSTMAGATSRVSAWHPVESAKALAEAAEAAYHGYPSLVVGSGSGSMVDGILGRTSSERKHIWFAVMGLLVETRCEFAVRRKIGVALLQCRDTGNEKPLSALSIYKWARQVLETPIEHPATPIMWQVFMSLYFEKAFDGHLNTPALGPRFFADQPNMVEVLEKRLSACSAYWNEKGNVRRAEDGPGRSLPERLVTLYNAMALWLREQVLVSTTHIDLAQFGERHLVGRLSDVVGGAVLEEGSELWTDYIQVDALQTRLKSLIVTLTVPSASPPSTPILSSKRVVNPVEWHSAPHPPPLLTLRPPVVQPLSSLNANTVQTQFDSDVAVILDKASAFRTLVTSAADGDIEYASHLQRLYIPETKRGRAEKSCTSKCLSPAIFEYRYSDVRVSSEARALVRDNRSRVEALMSIDGVEPKVVVSSLRLARIVEWLLDYDDHDLAVDLFYRTVQASETGAKGFPPALFILDRIIKSLGGRFVVSSLLETERVFSMLVNPDRCNELLDVFNPASTIKGTRFVEMFEEVASHRNLPDSVAASVLARFDILLWASKCSREDHLFMLRRLFVMLCNSPAAERSQAHRTALSNLLTVDVSLVIEAAKLMLQQCMTGKLPPSIITTVTSAMCRQPVDRDVLNTVATIPSRLTRSDLLGLASIMGCEMENSFFRSSPKSTMKKSSDLYATMAPYLEVLTEFLIAIFSADRLYSIMSDIHLDEIADVIRQVWLPFLYIVKEADYATRGGWPATHTEDAKRMQSSMVSLATKVFRNAAASERLLVFLWTIQAIGVSAGCPVMDVLYRELKTVSWSQFQITNMIVDQVLLWQVDGLFTLEPQRFLAHIINDRAEWPCLSITRMNGIASPNRSKFPDTVMAAVRLFLIILETSYEAHPAQSNRVTLYKSLETVIDNQVSWSNLAPVQYQELVNCLPSVWSGGAVDTTTMTEETRHHPILFALKTLRTMTGLEMVESNIGAADLDNRYSKLGLYIEYVLDLVAEAMKSSTIRKTFVPSQLNTIISQLVDFTESTPACEAQGHVLRQAYQRIFALLNSSDRTTGVFDSLWNGIQHIGQTCRSPLLLLSITCATLASVEHMAHMVEICIERYLQSSLAESGDVAWYQIASTLVIPELDAESFTRTCIVGGLALTLHAQAVQRLIQHTPMSFASPTRSSKTADGVSVLKHAVATGELMASWISSFRVDAIREGREGKIYVLLYLFSDLLALESESVSSNVQSHHSRLVASLVPVADALARWGEDRATNGLWGTLGMGAKSKLSVELRLFARCCAVFIATRGMLGLGSAAMMTNTASMSSSIMMQQPSSDDTKSRLIASVSELVRSREYERFSGVIESAVAILQDAGRGFESLEQMVDVVGRGVFPNDSGRVYHARS